MMMSNIILKSIGCGTVDKTRLVNCMIHCQALVNTSTNQQNTDLKKVEISLTSWQVTRFLKRPSAGVSQIGIEWALFKIRIVFIRTYLQCEQFASSFF